MGSTVPLDGSSGFGSGLTMQGGPLGDSRQAIEGPAVFEGSQGVRYGVVTEFSAERGLGSVTESERSWPFHAVAILDGSRAINPGSPVAFRLQARRPGVLEAIEIAVINDI